MWEWFILLGLPVILFVVGFMPLKWLIDWIDRDLTRTLENRDRD